MWWKAILLQFLLICFVHESYEFFDLKVGHNSRCEIFQLCDILPTDGKSVTQQQIEHINGRVRNTKQIIQSIELERALQAEREQLKWRRIADKYCEAPEHKINNILGCDDLHMTHENAAYFAELTKFCIELLRTAERGADNAKLIQTVNKCEQNAHSIVIYEQFKRLRSNLQQQCAWEKKRLVAEQYARRYEEQAKRLRSEATRFGNLIQNSIKVEANNRVQWNLAPEQIEPLLKLLGERGQGQDKIIVQVDDQVKDLNEKIESSEEAQILPTRGIHSEINDLVEIIARKKKQDINLKTQSLEQVTTRTACGSSAQQCGVKLAVKLTRSEIGSLVKFLEDKENENKHGNAAEFERLKKLVITQIKAASSACERGKATREQPTPKAISNCDETMDIELPESDVSKMIKILSERKEIQQRNRQNIEYTNQLQQNGLVPKPIEFFQGLFGGQSNSRPQNQNGPLRLQVNGRLPILI